MPIISEDSKQLYVNLYKELTNKNSAINLYLTGGKKLNENEKAVATAIKGFINKYETSYKIVMESKDEVSKSENGIGYTDMDYEAQKTYSTIEEEMFADLETDVELIRGALLTSVKWRLEGYKTHTYEFINEMTKIDEEAGITDSKMYTDTQKMNARAMAMEDAAGKLVNYDHDKLVENEKKTNMEYFHRPVVYKKETDEKTGETKYVKSERYISYKEQESPQYRFLEMKNHIEYDKKEDPDLNTVAALMLRDVLRNHKEMKEEADRRREYVKFINDQHQSYAVWKEQSLEEAKKYQNLLKQVDPDTLKRYNDHMANYNTATSLLSGTVEWFRKEHENYIALKSALEQKKAEFENQSKKIADQSVTDAEHYETMNKVLKEAKDDLEKFRSQPELDEETMQKDETELSDLLQKLQDEQQSLKEMENDFEERVAQQTKSREMLAQLKDEVDNYKELFTKLKKDAEKDNIKSIIEYHGKLIDAENGIAEEMNAIREKLTKIADDRKNLEDEQSKYNDEMNKFEDQRVKILKEHDECATDLAHVQEFLKNNSKAEKKNLKEFKTLMNKIRKDAVTYGYLPDVLQDTLFKESQKFAKEKNWDLKDTPAIFLDDEYYQDMVKENDYRVKKAAEMKVKFDEAAENYHQKSLELGSSRMKIEDLADDALAALEEYSKMLDTIQTRPENANNVIVDDMQKEANQVHDKGMKEMKAQEDALLKSHKELEQELEQKAGDIKAKKELIDKLVNQQEVLATRVNKAKELKTKLDEKQQAFDLMVMQQEEEKKDIEQRKIEAINQLTLYKSEYDLEQSKHGKEIESYENLEKLFNENQITNNRKLEDMAEFANNQVGKLANDAEKQRAYVRNKQADRCKDIVKELDELKSNLIDLEKPQGFMKSKNSREFTAFRNEMRKYLDMTVRVPNPNAEKGYDVIDNKNEIVSRLTWLSNEKEFNVTDKSRIENMKVLKEAMENIAKVADDYLKAKGAPDRSTEQGRARYHTATMIRTYANKVAREMGGMMSEEQLILDEANVALVTQPSGMKSPDYEKTAGFKYVGDSLKREGDVKYTDADYQREQDLNALKLMNEQQEKQEQQKQQQAQQKQEPEQPIINI